MSFPQWATPERRDKLVELFVRGQGFCIYGHGAECPKPLEHCYEVASEDIIFFWKEDDREARSQALQLEKRRLHAIPRIVRRGPWDTIRREEWLAQRPTWRIVGIGVSAFTQHRVAKVEIPEFEKVLWVDLSYLKTEGLSKNKLRKLARYNRGAIPKSLVAEMEARVKSEVRRYLRRVAPRFFFVLAPIHRPPFGRGRGGWP